jgi:hypothetical protein
MELILNLVWMLLAVAIVRLWVRYAPKEGSGRWTQIFALIMLILILFPVISVTDDLQASQTLAEDVTTLRRDIATTHCYHLFAAESTVPPAAFTEFAVGFLCFVAPCHLPVPTVDNPAIAAIQNRPPPAFLYFASFA